MWTDPYTLIYISKFCSSEKATTCTCYSLLGVKLINWSCKNNDCWDSWHLEIWFKIQQFPRNPFCEFIKNTTGWMVKSMQWWETFNKNTGSSLQTQFNSWTILHIGPQKLGQKEETFETFWIKQKKKKISTLKIMWKQLHCQKPYQWQKKPGNGIGLIHSRPAKKTL